MPGGQTDSLTLVGFPAFLRKPEKGTRRTQSNCRRTLTSLLRLDKHPGAASAEAGLPVLKLQVCPGCLAPVSEQQPQITSMNARLPHFHQLVKLFICKELRRERVRSSSQLSLEKRHHQTEKSKFYSFITIAFSFNSLNFHLSMGGKLISHFLKSKM